MRVGSEVAPAEPDAWRAERRGLGPFLLALLALIAVWLGPALKGELFVSTELIWNTVQPWSGAGPSAALHNPNLADPPTVWWPMMRFSAQLLREWLAGGSPPLWVHESYAGAPWLGNPQSALLSPFTWAFVWLPEVAAFAIVAAAKWLIAGLGAWFLARRLGASPLARGVAGIAFAFCGYQVVWIDSPLSNVSVVAPWLLLVLARLVERPGAARTAVAALVSWQVVVGGHPETAFWVAVAAVVFAGGEWLACRAERGRALLALGAAALLAALLAVVQWWPFLEYALASFGNELRRATPCFFARPFAAERLLWCLPLVAAWWLARRADASAAAGRGGAGWWWIGASAAAALLGVVLRREGLQGTLLLQLVPDLFGRSLDGGTYGGPFTYCDVVGGFAGAALGVIAATTALLCRPRRERQVGALLVALLLVGARGARIPVLVDAAEAQATLTSIGSSRALAVLGLAIALLGALGLDRLRAAPRRMAAAMALPLAFAGAVVVTPIAPVAGATDFVADGCELSAPERLAPAAGDAGAASRQLGATFRGVAPSGATAVRVAANGAPLATIALPEAARASAPGGGSPFEWCFLLSERLEEGWLALEFAAVAPDGRAIPFAKVTRSTARAFQFDGRVALHLGAVLLVLLVALAGRGPAAAWTLAIVTTAELAFFGARYQATTPVERVPTAIAPIPWLQEQRATLGPYRLFTARTHLHPSLHLPFGIEVTRGYDALEPLAYVRLLDELAPGRGVPWVQMDFSTLDFAAPRGRAIADVLGVRWFLSEEPPPADFEEAWRRGTLALWENPGALARAFTVQSGQPLRAVVAAGLDPRTIACWDDDPAGGRELGFGGSARIAALAHQRGYLRADVESDCGTIVVFSENFGGWQATLDGVPAAILRSHLTLQSVVVPSGGRHVVEFRYRPRSVVYGAAISAFGLLLVLLLLLRSALGALGRRTA